MPIVSISTRACVSYTGHQVVPQEQDQRNSPDTSSVLLLELLLPAPSASASTFRGAENTLGLTFLPLLVPDAADTPPRRTVVLPLVEGEFLMPVCLIEAVGGDGTRRFAFLVVLVVLVVMGVGVGVSLAVVSAREDEDAAGVLGLSGGLAALRGVDSFFCR